MASLYDTGGGDVGGDVGGYVGGYVGGGGSGRSSKSVVQTTSKEIDEVIRRHGVERGSGIRRFEQVGLEHWTDTDQQELDRLLAEGRDVYVPPDVSEMDLPVPRDGHYSYVIAKAPREDLREVDESMEKRSMAERIAMWNEVVPSAAAVGISGPFTAGPVMSPESIMAPEAPVMSPEPTGSHDASGRASRQIEIERRQLLPLPPPSPPRHAAQTRTTPAHPLAAQPPAGQPPVAADALLMVTQHQQSRTDVDVSRTIFGGTFLTVPVISKMALPSNSKELMLHQSDVLHEQQLATPPAHDVLLRSESTAEVNVTEDYGLKGGHDSIVHDATFVHRDRKLVTCGADGRVCIWDMRDRSVQYEFTPYDNGEAVTMVYPLAQMEDNDTDLDADEHDDDDEMYTLMTLSESRILRIWLLDGKQAIMLRNSEIKDCETDLYMTVTPISKSLKAKAVAAAAAAAIRTSDQLEHQAVTGGTAPGRAAEELGEVDDLEGVGEAVNEEEVVLEDEEEEEEEEEEVEEVEEVEEKGRKRFSLSKVLSFTRTGSRKAVAS